MKKNNNKKKTTQKFNNELFPVSYKGKLWTHDECNEIYLAFYHTRDALNLQGGVYLSEHTWIYPDGTLCHW